MEEKEFDYINVIPLVDIMLVLLTIVLVTATFIVQGSIPVRLPTSKHTNIKNIRSFQITITEKGEIFFERRKVKLEELDKEIREKERLIREELEPFREKLLEEQKRLMDWEKRLLEKDSRFPFLYF